MYCAGKLPDHVTRYNHKSTSRWLVPPREPRNISLSGLVDGIVLAMSGAALIVAAVFIMQAV